MSEDFDNPSHGGRSAFIGIVAVLAVLASAGSLYWSYNLQQRLERSQTLLGAAQQQNDKLALDLDATNARLSVTSETLGQSVGLTQQELEKRATELLRQEHAETARLSKAEAQNRQQIGQVTGQVSTVQTAMGTVAGDVGQQKIRIQDASTRLQGVASDVNVHTNQIAANQRDLEALKHKGDRNVFDFVLYQGGSPTLVSNVRLQLRKSDPKHERYTLDVIADDRKVEKKDMSLMQPVQFYTSKNNLLYELVVNKIETTHVSGYLTTPKNTAASSDPAGSNQRQAPAVASRMPIVASSAPGPSDE